MLHTFMLQSDNQRLQVSTRMEGPVVTQSVRHVQRSHSKVPEGMGKRSGQM